jgi:L-serine dehydratase
MIGPSSSHIAASARIGYLVGQSVEYNPKKVFIEFEKGKSYAANYIGLKSNKAFIAGIIGWKPDDPRLPLSIIEAKKRKIEIDFIIRDIKKNTYSIQNKTTIKEHRKKYREETIKIVLISKHDEKYTILAKSLGGGMIEIIEINDLPVLIFGNSYEGLILLEDESENDVIEICKQIESTIQDILAIDYSICKRRSHINIKTNYLVDYNTFQLDKKLKKNTKIFQIKPILPVLNNKKCNILFRTAREMNSFSKNNNVEFWEAGLMYESAVSGWTAKEILKYLEKIITIMKNAIKSGLNSDEEELGYKKTEAKKIYNAYKNGKFLYTGILDKAIIYALAIMETNSTSSLPIVATPTAGACGILPAVILSIGENDSISNDRLIKALLVSGGIGLAIANQATFAGDVGGCQAECGSASSMAAAAASDLASGNSEQILSAASIALQNVLGLICDPVDSQVIIPCINRNFMAVSNAITSANVANSGYNSIIPLDEVIQAMYMVGTLLAPELKGTGLGGLRATVTAQKISSNNLDVKDDS